MVLWLPQKDENTCFTVISIVSQRVFADAFVRSPIFDTRGAVQARIRIARWSAVLLDHIGKPSIHVSVQVDYFVVHNQTAEATD